MAEALQLAITAVYSAVEGVQLNQESCARFKKHVQDTERTVVRAASAAKLRPERSVAVRDLTKLYHDAADFMAGFKKKELSVDIQPGKRTITITGQVDEKNPKRQRIARRNFTRTFVNYDDNLDLEEAEAQFENGLLTVRVPQRPEAQPLTIEIK